MARLYELLTRDAESETILTDIYRTVVEAAKTKLIATNLLALRFGPGDIPGSSLKIIGQTKNAMVVHKVGEGQEVPISNEKFHTYTATPDKYGLRPLITREMQEDSLFPLIERALRESGYQMARKLDSLVFTAMRAGAGNTVAGGAAITVANIATGIYNLEVNDFEATDFIIGGAIANDLRNIDTFVEANKAGVSDPSKSLIGTIFGMRVWTTNQMTNATDALIIDRTQAAWLAEKRPITIERYNDVTRQLDGIVCSSRWSAGVLIDTDGGTTTNAINLITTS